jgi:thiol-disulfide isomerase/thioredoxin
MVNRADLYFYEYKGYKVDQAQILVMRIWLLSLLLILQQAVYAQTADSIKIMGQIVPDSGLTFKADKADVRLVPYNENESVCTTLVNNDGSFTVKVAAHATDIYDLKYKGYKMTLLLSPTEPVYRVTIKTDEKQEVKTMKVSGSRENDAYRIFKRENVAFKDKLRDLKGDCMKSEKDCLVKYVKLCAAQNEVMEYLKKVYKGTFTANVLANLGEVPALNGTASLSKEHLGVTVTAQMQAGFFDDANLADTSLYRTPDLSNKISVYLDYIADTNATARLQLINGLMDKVKGKREAQKGMLTLLFNNFLDEYREPYIESLVKWAASQPKLGDDQPVLAAKIKLVANVLPGLPAPDVTGENTSQQTQNLLTTAKANKLTVLIFWESDCPHCRKAMPEFVRLYKQYHPKGLEVFAASMDSDTSRWKLFINYNHLTWTNIVLPEKSSVHADYFIQYTPTVVLIDDKGRIIRRFISVEDLGKGISDVLDGK